MSYTNNDKKEKELIKKNFIYKQQKKKYGYKRGRRYVYTKKNRRKALMFYKKGFKIFRLKGFDKYKRRRRRRFVRKRIYFFLFINLTVNNLFAHVYNFYIATRKKRVKTKFDTFKIFSISSGLSKYSGKARLSNIALETVGRMFAKKLYFNKIRKVNLVLTCRLNRKIKEFIKGLRGIEIKRIFFFPKIAHNGCRLRSRKRL
jgi:ribosomal protein S11